MHRSFAWGMIAILAIMLAPFAGVPGVPGVPASAVQADTASPAVVPPDDELIVITSGGMLRVDDPYTAPGYKVVSWSSASEPGWETGWTVVAGGDFNGDGDAELVAARGSVVRVFDPVPQPGKSPVIFSVDMGSQRNVRFLYTGDFDADGKDEFAVMYYIPGSGNQAGLSWYDGGANATQGEWQLRNTAEYGAMFQDMGVGDFNADGADDLVMVRNVSTQRLVTALNVRTWSTLAEGNYTRPWFAVAGGNLSTSTPGDEIALTRDGGNATLEGLILFRVVSGVFTDLVTNALWKWNPDFTSLANGDLNGDGDDEVVMLRDPVEPKVSLLTVNPAGAAWNPTNSFEQATGYGSAAFRIVRTGDTDGDGKDEIVILKSDRYWIYTEPNVDARGTETAGPFYTPGTVSNLPFLALANVDGPGQVLGPVLDVTPTVLNFTLEYRQPAPTQNVSIKNIGTSDVLNWQAAVTSNTPWLVLSAPGGATPGNLGVSIATTNSALVPGTYTGKISISATGGSGTIQKTPQEVTVNVTITGVTMVVSPQVWEPKIGYGETAPEQVTKQVTISSAGGSAPFTWRAAVQGGSDWLSVSPTGGTTPSKVTVSIKGRANPPGGPYLGSIVFMADDPNIANRIAYLTVSLTVTDAGIVVWPSTVSIQHLASAAEPTTAQVLIERPGIETSWTTSVLSATLTSAARAKLDAGEYQVTDAGLVFDGLDAPALDWLTIKPTSGTTPSTMTLEVQGSKPGIYKATIFVNSTTGTKEIHVTGWISESFHHIYLPMTMKQ